MTHIIIMLDNHSGSVGFSSHGLWGKIGCVSFEDKMCPVVIAHSIDHMLPHKLCSLRIMSWSYSHFFRIDKDIRIVVMMIEKIRKTFSDGGCLGIRYISTKSYIIVRKVIFDIIYLSWSIGPAVKVETKIFKFFYYFSCLFSCISRVDNNGEIILTSEETLVSEDLLLEIYRFL